MSQCRRAVQAAPENFWGHYFLAVALHKVGRPAEATRIFERAISMARTSQQRATALAAGIMAAVAAKDCSQARVWAERYAEDLAPHQEFVNQQISQCR